MKILADVKVEKKVVDILKFPIPRLTEENIYFAVISYYGSKDQVTDLF